ncbi:MAG: alpha-amylase family glycosyl hydrolase [Pontiellaceae bacterium]
MSDFHQSGVITTFHNLRTQSIEQQEQEVRKYAKQSPVSLVLPSLYSELEGEALPRIVQILSEMDYINQIIIGLDRATLKEYKHALDFFSGLPQNVSLLWNDGDRMRNIDHELSKYNLSPKQPGKGRNVWYMFGYALAQRNTDIIAVHDCDITTYNRDMLIKLLYPVINPQLNFKYSKGFYSRIANRKMNGRVCRLLITPLLRALKKVCGSSEYLDYMDSFKYALSGEFAFQQDILSDIRIPSDWGLEMGMLSEIYRNQVSNKVCQVDISDFYDHKHQSMSFEDSSKGLSKMSHDISKSMFRKMATFGEVFSEERIRTIKAAYYRIALDLVDSYESDAIMNGIDYDRHNELKSIELFSQNIILAGHDFLTHPKDMPFIPSWKRVVSAVPNIFEKMIDAVENDKKEFGSNHRTFIPKKSLLDDQLKSHLDNIYKNQDNQLIANKMIEASGLSRNKTYDLRNQKRWSQNDIILITYANSIINKDEYPLKTLNKFLRNYFSDTISGIHILPFYPYSSDDGFSVIDYYKVDNKLGSWKDIQNIGREFDLMTDLVINHCSSDSAWFKNHLNKSEPGKDYFFEPDKNFDTSHVVRPRSSDLLSEFTNKDNKISKVWTTFSKDQVDLNFKNPEVLIEICKLLKFYIDNNIKFFRLDAVAFIWKESGTSCVHLNQTHEIVKLIRLILENINNESVIITETNVPNKENLSYFGNGNEAHLIYNFSLPPLLIYTLLCGDSNYLKSWMMSMPPAREGRSYFNFIASHDGIGIRPIEGLLEKKEQKSLLRTLKKFGGHISPRINTDGTESPYEVNISLYDAFKGTIKSGEDNYQVERMLCAHTILLALEGIPAIYSHSFFGTSNDNDLVNKTGRHRSINRHKWNEIKLKNIITKEGSSEKKLFDELRRRIKIRKKQEAFHPNATQLTLHFGSKIFAFWRESINRTQCIFCINNITDKSQKVSLLELNLIGTETWYDILSGHKYDNKSSIKLKPYESIWISN